jgi:hypothetical protein
VTMRFRRVRIGRRSGWRDIDYHKLSALTSSIDPAGRIVRYLMSADVPYTCESMYGVVQLCACVVST